MININFRILPEKFDQKIKLLNSDPSNSTIIEKSLLKSPGWPDLKLFGKQFQTRKKCRIPYLKPVAGLKFETKVVFNS